jgi:CarD family transcriptional regulator
VTQRLGALTRMGLAVGDLVVYASHGIGRVAAREQRPGSGGQREVVVLEFAEGLSVTLPIERAVQYVRPVSTEAELALVRITLRGDDAFAEDAWQKRLKATRAKVTLGEAVGLAEVVRDGLRRDQRSSVRGEQVRLSLSERQLYLQARRLLADEIGASRGVEAAEADAWIDRQLALAGQEAELSG